ncbi:MAG TPA: hypothetical protein VMF91_11845 [Bryobacteraceae bacterium]|nr:hypothetical protein [Bryobacteraceae bacterium]
MPERRTEHIPLQDELPSLIEMLRTPAGGDSRFATRELIAANHDAFCEQCHVVWKELHRRSIDEIMNMESLLSPEHRKAMPPAMIFYFNRCVQIWRRLNDALIWVLLDFQDHIIRTVCHRKDRPQLASANPDGIRRLLMQLNTDPLTIAIWSDATTCVDLGDVFCKAPPGKPNGFLEVKEGTINDKIFELLKAKGSPEHIAAKIDSFVDENGPKAFKQLERVIRQRRLYNQVMDIVENERGFDPRREAEVIIGESHAPLESYDFELQAATDAAAEKPVLRCIDECLWVYVDANQEKSPQKKIEEFRAGIQAAAPEALPWIHQQFEGKLPFEAIPLEANIDIPESMPLFLRPLNPKTIRDVLLGRLMHSVFLFLDWKELTAIIRKQGAELVWSSFKEGRRQIAKPLAHRFLTIGGRVPRIRLENGNYTDGFSKLYRIYYDGISPSSIAAQYIELLRGEVSFPLKDGADRADLPY